MSQENVDVIRASFEFWRDGRTGEWIGTLDADIEWDISAHPLLRVFKTRAEALEALGLSE
jgi:ketosteroid isomerase-like protein